MKKPELRMLIVQFLALHGTLKSDIESGVAIGIDHKLPPEKPSHGPCCTCQQCGRDYDYCVCGHNDTLDELDKYLGECVEYDVMGHVKTH